MLLPTSIHPTQQVGRGCAHLFVGLWTAAAVAGGRRGAGEAAAWLLRALAGGALREELGRRMAAAGVPAAQAAALQWGAVDVAGPPEPSSPHGMGGGGGGWGEAMAAVESVWPQALALLGEREGEEGGGGGAAAEVEVVLCARAAASVQLLVLEAAGGGEVASPTFRLRPGRNAQAAAAAAAGRGSSPRRR
jgi:hypothetical protein